MLTGQGLAALRKGRTLSDRAYGIEIEFRGNGKSMSQYCAAMRAALRPFYGSYSSMPTLQTDEYGHSDGSTWDMKPDGSAEYEIASPRLTASDWPKVEAVLLAIVKAGGTVDKSCGLHVHHEALDLELKHIRNLIRMWAAFDGVIHEALPPSRRDNEYCHRSFASEDYEPGYFADADNIRSRILNQGRYESLNLTIWWRSGRLEFRSHAGTLDASKVFDWLRLTQRFVETARYGRPQRIIAGSYHWKLYDGFKQLPAVVGSELADIWQGWLRKRNRVAFQMLAAQAAAAALFVPPPLPKQPDVNYEGVTQYLSPIRIPQGPVADDNAPQVDRLSEIARQVYYRAVDDSFTVANPTTRCDRVDCYLCEREALTAFRTEHGGYSPRGWESVVN